MNAISRIAGLFLCVALTVFLGDALAASVTRGPYLQLETPDSITVRWRTDQASDSVVRHGSAPGSLTDTVTASGNTTEHTVELNGLVPDTLYYYSVGDASGAMAGDDASHFFRTAPTPGTEKPTRIWVIGDSGTADANARAVRDAYKTYTGSRVTDLWLMLGDNAYNDGTDSQYQAAVFETYPEILRQAAVWPTLGNHDGYTADSATQSGPYYDIFTLPTNGEAGGLASGTEAYYSFDYGNIHFICLESYETDRSVGGAMMTWLQSDLTQNDKPWVVAFWHHPPYTKGSHNSDSEGNLIDMRQNALPILEAWGVDLVLAGHSHSYERSYLLDGHYGSSSTLDSSMILDGGDGRETGDGPYEKTSGVAVANEGAVFAVAGSSGKISGGSLNHPAMFISMNTLGSMVLDVAGNRLDALFLDSTGAVGDSFTITKGDDETPPALLVAEALDDISVSVQFSEPLDQTGAETVSNYAVDQGITVAAATLSVDSRTVTLDTSVIAEGLTYTLTVNGLSDLAGNPIAANSQAQFSFVTLVTKSFKDGVAPTEAYSGTRDTYLSQNSSNSNFGSASDLLADGDDPQGTSNDLATLIAWDLTEIPVDAQVESASIAINVFNPSNGAYDLFEVLRDWEEGAATWNQAASGASWETAGAKGASDRGSSVLSTISASATGAYSLNLNASGLSVIQGWIDGSSPNYGLILANSSTTDGLDFDSSDSSAANRPQLTITYSVPATSTDTEPPTSPGNLRQTDVTSTTAMLAWDAATDNVGVVGYKVNRDGQLVATVVGTSYEDTELQPGTAYDYTVAAYDAANNESVPAGPLAVTTDTVPLSHVQDISLQVVDAGPTRHATSQVTVLDGTAQPVADATVQADWSGLASGAVSGITLVDGTVSFASDDVPSAVFGQLVFTVTDVSAAGYFYDEASNSETADCITTAGTDCHSVPGAPVAPTGLTALGALSAIDLDWDDSADTSVTGYTVYRSATSGSGFQPLVSIASSAHSDGTVGAGVPYYYAVVAYYSSGAASPFSGEAWAVAGETTLSFQDGVSPVAIYAGTRDTYIAQADPSTNAGSGVDLQADGDDPPSSGNDLSSLLAWDLSAIPNGAVIQSASIEIEVYNVSTGSYQFYEVKRDWSESEATWNQAASGSSWTSAGASHEADDRGSQVLATISASATGTYSVDLGPDGLAVLQAWVDGERPNNGFILADSGTTDGLDFHSSEASTAAYRPKLTLSYVIPDPNQAPSASFTATPGTGEFSLNVNFDASGSSDPDGTIADYAWDFGDGTGGSGATPLHSYGAAGTYNAELTVTDDDGATDISNLAVVVTEPPNQAPSASFTATPGTGQSSLNVNFDASGSSDPDGTIADYAWDFGDGTGGSGVNASHSYSAAGTYDAELTVTDNDGATGVANHTIVVSEPPPTGPAISTGTVTGVGSSGWTTVILPRSYTSMVVVASANYDSGSVPGVVRIQNAAVDRFDVRMDVAANSGDITGASIHYVVVEEGVYTAAEHGVSMEAVKFDSTLTDRSGSWVGTAQTYANVYSDPVVIGQVMSYNDSGFSVFWARGSSRKNPPSAGSLYVGKHVAQDADKTRADETIGYLVIEAGQGTVGGLAYAAGAGADNVWGVTNSPPYGYATSGLQNATTAVVSSAAMDGGDGGWPVLYGSNPVGGGSLSLAIDEDQIKDTERNHTSEQVAYLVLGPAAP